MGSGIHRLKLSCRRVECEALVSGAWAQLHTLNIAGCSKLTDASIEALAEHCPALASLDASGVQTNITEAALKALRDRLTTVRLDRLRPKSHAAASKTVLGMLTSKLQVLSAAEVGLRNFASSS